MTTVLDRQIDDATGAPTTARRSTARQPQRDQPTVKRPPGSVTATKASGATGLVSRIPEVVAAALGWLGTALLLLTGVALAVSGLGLTGGSFGLLAFIGIPLLVVGLGMISAAQAMFVDRLTPTVQIAPIPTPAPTTTRSIPTQGAHTP